MGEWISVFCRRPVQLEPARISDVLDDSGLATPAEPRAEPAADAGASIDVHYRASGRPLQISTASGREAEAQITETMAEFPMESQEAGVLLVREHLNMCVQVINIEMDADAADSDGADGAVGAELGGELAYALAEDGEGLVWLFDRDWVSPSDRATPLWTNPA